MCLPVSSPARALPPLPTCAHDVRSPTPCRPARRHICASTCHRMVLQQRSAGVLNHPRLEPFHPRPPCPPSPHLLPQRGPAAAAFGGAVPRPVGAVAHGGGRPGAAHPEEGGQAEDRGGRCFIEQHRQQHTVVGSHSGQTEGRGGCWGQAQVGYTMQDCSGPLGFADLEHTTVLGAQCRSADAWPAVNWPGLFAPHLPSGAASDGRQR